eukprot:12401446-Karenia_brevis.AAC.1
MIHVGIRQLGQTGDAITITSTLQLLAQGLTKTGVRTGCDDLLYAHGSTWDWSRWMLGVAITIQR